jgi:hypothetical protein
MPGFNSWIEYKRHFFAVLWDWHIFLPVLWDVCVTFSHRHLHEVAVCRPPVQAKDLRLIITKGTRRGARPGKVPLALRGMIKRME